MHKQVRLYSDSVIFIRITTYKLGNMCVEQALRKRNNSYRISRNNGSNDALFGCNNLRNIIDLMIYGKIRLI